MFVFLKAEFLFNSVIEMTENYPKWYQLQLDSWGTWCMYGSFSSQERTQNLGDFSNQM